MHSQHQIPGTNFVTQGRPRGTARAAAELRQAARALGAANMTAELLRSQQYSKRAPGQTRHGCW
eukprot:9768112-Prorocentrum_lima.AAC.1